MGRIRSIKPEFFTNEKLSALSLEAHFLAAGLLTHSDDEGYFNANPKLIHAALCPLRSVKIHGVLTELSNIGFLRLGTAADGREYGQVVGFTTHQRVNRPTPSKIIDLDISWRTHGGLTEDSLPEGKGKEGKGREHEGAVALPDWLPAEVWENFKGHRKALRRPMTAFGERALLSKLENLRAAGHDAVDCLTSSIANGWQGVFPPKPNGAADGKVARMEKFMALTGGAK